MRGPLIGVALLVSAPAWGQAGAGPQGPGRAFPAQLHPCAGRGVPTETYAGEVELESLIACDTDFAGAWSTAFAPLEEFLYVSLFGGNVGASNCLVARFDAETYELLQSFSVDHGPQEFAFTTRPSGRMEYGFVTCSSASTVVVFDPEDNILASIPIPFDATSAYATAFPFGIVTAPDESRVYVGTLDGSGDIHVIDTSTLALLPAEKIAWGADHGIARMIFHGSTLVAPIAEYLPGFTGSTAKVGFVDPADRRNASMLTLVSASDGILFPAPQDVAIGCGGKLYLAGFDMGARVWVLDAESRSLRRTIPTLTSQANGKFQGLAATPEGYLAVADFFTDEIAVIDTQTDRWQRTIDVESFATHRQVNEITFDPRSRRMLATCLTTENLAAFELD